MGLDEILRAVFNYGFPSVMLIAVALCGWKLINKIIGYNKEREDKLMNLIQNEVATMNKTLLMSLEHIIEFRKMNDEAHRFQREEHKEIHDELERIKDRITSRKTGGLNE